MKSSKKIVMIILILLVVLLMAGVAFAYVYVATDHFGSDDHPITFYDTEWNMLNVKYGHHKTCEIERPKFFDEMLEMSRKLSKDMPFVRVDFFETEEQLYVAELTFYPGGGFSYFNPPSFNKELGDKFILPKN